MQLYLFVNGRVDRITVYIILVTMETRVFEILNETRGNKNDKSDNAVINSKRGFATRFFVYSVDTL